MTKVRTFIHWCTLAVLGGLAILCVVGAFLGADRASDMFNSPPCMALWAAIALLLLISLILVKPVRRSPALVMAHVAPLLILIGGFLGSPFVHGLLERFAGRSFVRSGYIVLSESETTNRVIGGDFERFVGRLPFRLKLEDFQIEYYEPRDEQWALALVEPARRNRQSTQTTVEWQEGHSTALPGLRVDLKVLEYVKHARPVYGKQVGPAVEITGPNGNSYTLPAEDGQEVSLNDKSITVRIAEVLHRQGSGEHNPSLQLEIDRPAGAYSTYLTPRFASSPRSVDELQLRYVLARPTDAVSDPTSDTPAMRIRLSHGAREVTQWLIPRQGARFVGTDLGRLLTSKEGATADQTSPALYLVRPERMVKDYKSHLAVLENERVVLRKTVEVNYPLHYGGYHIYQSSYGGEDQPYVGLMVRSDTGLYLVYAGFGLLVASVFWWGWARPIIRFWKGKADAA